MKRTMEAHPGRHISRCNTIRYNVIAPVSMIRHPIPYSAVIETSIVLPDPYNPDTYLSISIRSRDCPLSSQTIVVKRTKSYTRYTFECYGRWLFYTQYFNEANRRVML